MANTPPPAFSGSIPEKYDQYLGPYFFEPYAVDTVERVHTGTIKSALEVACGTGRVTAHLRKKLSPDARLVATDLNPGMLDVAQKRLQGENVEWKVADIQALPFEDQSFDLFVCQFCLMFVPDKELALREAYRVLKPGGQILLTTWGSLENNPSAQTADQIMAKYFPVDPPKFFQVPYSMYDDKELLSLFQRAGFNHCTVDYVKKAGKSSSAANTVTGMLEGSPIYANIVERDAAILPLMKQELESLFIKAYGDHPMVSPIEALIVDAKK